MSAKGLIELAMDQDSRMQRAREQGLSSRGYHGTNADEFDAFDLSMLGTGSGGKDTKHGFYFSGRRDTADAYRESYPQIKPDKFRSHYGISIEHAQKEYAHLRDNLVSKGYDVRRGSRLQDRAFLKDNPDLKDDIDQLRNLGDRLNPYNYDNPRGGIYPRDWVDDVMMGRTNHYALPDISRMRLVDMECQAWDESKQSAIAQLAKDEGFDGVIFKNMQDSGWFGGAGLDDITLVFDPANIRSVNAAFDPRYLNSSKLMGDGPSAADLQPDERLRNLLNNVKTLGAIAGKRGVEDISDCASVQILLQLDTDWWPEVTPDSAKEKVANVWWSARNAAAKSESLARNKVTNEEMPMDYASRMMRAREQGFEDDTVYRGLYGEYDPVKAGHYQFFTSSPQDAGEYGNSIVAAKIKRGKNLEYDARGRNFNNLSLSGLPAAVYDNLHWSIKNSLSQTARSDDIAHAAKAAGYDSVTLKNIYDKADNEIPLKPAPANRSDADLLSDLGIDLNDPILSGNLPQRQEAIVAPKDYNTANVDIVFDPSNIRSINAAFDPRYLDSSNLMGDGPSAAEPELDERLRNLLNNVKTIGAIAGKRGVENISDCASVQILLQLDTDWWPEVTPDSAKEKVANVWWSARNAAAESENLAQNKGPDAQSPQTHSGISNETKMYAPSPG